MAKEEAHRKVRVLSSTENNTFFLLWTHRKNPCPKKEKNVVFGAI
jgi:hypothetical protein